MAVLVDVDDAPAQLLAVVAPVVFGGLDPEHLRVVLADEGGCEEVVNIGGAVPLVDELVDVTGEEGLHAVSLQQSEQPGSGGLVYVVVVARLSWLQNVGRVVAKYMYPLFLVRLQICLQPSGLLGFVGEPRVQGW